jgi:hypothetical protein
VGTVRRVVSGLLMSVLLAAGLMASGAAAASAAAPQASTFCKDGVTVDCIQAPRSTIKGKQHVNEKTTTYCVENYKGHSVIKVVDDKTGKVVSIHTNANGVGCTQVPVTVACQNLLAQGPSQDGSPGHSSARLCVTSTTTAHPGSSSAPGAPAPVSSGGLPFTGSNIIIPGTIIGLVLIGVGFFAVLLGRRRRDDDDEAPAAV